MSAYTVGQTVLWFAPNKLDGEPREVEVTKVGRTRVTVGGIWGTQFHMDTGWGVKDFTGRIATREQYAEERRRTQMLDALRDNFGLSPHPGGLVRHISTAALEKVLDVLRADREAQS